METNAGWLPGVAPGQGQAQRVGRLGRLDVQVVPDLHVVGHEPDGDHHHGLRPGLGQLTQVIAMSGSSHGWEGGPLRLW
jgi:hypothetical protein